MIEIDALISSEIFTADSLQPLLIAILLVLSAIPSLVAFVRRDIDVFEPILVYSIFMFMTSLSIFDRVYIQEPYILHSKWVPWEFSKAFFIITLLYTLFFSTVLVGYYLRIERWFPAPRFIPTTTRHNSTLLRYISAIYVITGILSYILLIGSAFDWNLMHIYTTMEPRSNVFKGSYPFRLGARFLYVGYLLWVTATIVDGYRPAFFHLSPLFPIIGLFLLLGGRAQVIRIILATIILLYYTHIYPILEATPRRMQLVQDTLHKRFKLSILPVCGIFIGFGTILLGVIRSGQGLRDASIINILVKIVTFGVAKDIFDYLLVTLAIVPEQIDHYYGTFIFRVPLNYIPRYIWAEKPVLTAGSVIRRTVLPNGNGGRPPGMIGRFYLDGGLVAVILGALLFGITLRLLYLCLTKNRHSPLFVLVYAFCFASIGTGIGNNAVWYLLTHILILSPALAMDWLSRHNTQSDSMS